MPRSVKGVRRTVVWETKRETVGDRQAPSAATLIPCPGMSGLRGTETKIRKSAAIGRPTGMPSQTVGRRRGRCTAARTSLRSENPMCCARARFRSHSIAHAAHVTRCGATWSISDARSVHVVMTSSAVAACDRRAVVNEPCRQERPRSQQRRSARVPRSHTAAHLAQSVGEPIGGLINAGLKRAVFDHSLASAEFPTTLNAPGTAVSCV